jgi:hypothetical protein
MSKLTDDQMAAVIANMVEPARVLAARYGVSVASICRARVGTTVASRRVAAERGLTPRPWGSRPQNHLPLGLCTARDREMIRRAVQGDSF